MQSISKLIGPVIIMLVGLSNTVLAERPDGGPKLMLDGAVQ